MKQQICYFKGNDDQMKNNETGRTMLEMLGVLGIMGIIMYGAVAGINYGMNTYKINQIYNEVQEAVQSIQDIYSWQKGYSGIRAATLCQNDVFTRCTDNTPRNVFEGAISVEAIKGNSLFSLTYANIPEDICFRLKEMDWGTILMDSDCDAGAGVLAGADVVFCPANSDNNCE